MSSEVSVIDPALPQPFAVGEWEAIVAAAVANVAEIEAAQAQDDPAEAAVYDLLEAQPAGARAALSLPVPAGACARVPTWHSRRHWLTLCEWIVTHTDRGCAALKRHGIAAATFLQVCAAHAEYAESTTGRRVSASLDTLASQWGLSIDKLKRGRRVLKALELGVELARGKKLNAIEREAAARLYAQAHDQQAPARLQIGAASVWALSAPLWAVEAMPAPEKPQRRSRRRRARSHRGTAAHPGSRAKRSSGRSAPQSPGGSFSVNLSARKDHQARERAGKENSNSTMIRPLTLQRAAAELVDRIPALRTAVGIDDSTGHRRGHIGSVCDLLIDAGIDTDRWTGSDIAQALNHDGATRGWTWPTTEAMTSPLRLVAFRLSQLDWTGPSLTERKVRGRDLPGEAPAATAHRLVKARRSVLADESATQAPRASAEHRRALRAQLAADLAAKKEAAA
ncbi:hypothetical protein [Rhodococcus artemisiae]|uniref:Replication protein n=1 Tax=Rhodococcus artemisiae TaxID=714159 RepID=A0ABU7LJ34_9NOCA|nr:hypothetical protein [Rhodococcus artemisiae]MEE2061581.1 hypothetical protein [Rhodococcus artemisiae]